MFLLYNYKKYHCKNSDEKEDENKQIYVNINRGRILLLEIKEENNSINLTIKKYIEGGPYYYINCQNLFFDKYFFASITKNNCLLKLNDDGNFTQYFEMNN